MCRNGSRAAGFDKCNSTTGGLNAASASCRAHDVWVKAPALMMMAEAQPRASWMASISSPSWFDLPNGGGDVICQGLRPVDGRFAVAEKVEVRP